MNRGEKANQSGSDGGNAYSRIIEAIFLANFRAGMERVDFARLDIEKFAASLKIALPKNLGDLIYSFRYRQDLPAAISRAAPMGKSWVIRPVGRAKYAFVASSIAEILPNPNLARTSVPDATPGIIEMYRLGDEQALLARVRYNRLIDIFTGVTCYALQSHLRATVKGMGQVETDELYVGLDKRGAHFVFLVQAKRGNDRINVVQIEQDIAMCAAKFPDLICIPIAACAMEDRLVAMFAFEADRNSGECGVSVTAEKHYRFVPPDQISPEDLQSYARNRWDA
ncbi:MAG: endonuclease [Phycisphaerae bacterium]|nr:endonuclease [Phycisphaerae bacterium]